MAPSTRAARRRLPTHRGNATQSRQGRHNIDLPSDLFGKQKSLAQEWPAISKSLCGKATMPKSAEDIPHDHFLET